MNFLRKLLFPFSLLYGGITALRNLLYNKGILKSQGYNLPIICVGNLSTGGTGKSPMIEFLVQFLKDNYNIAVLSRGYKRNTSGYHEVQLSSSVYEVGDEPLQFKKKFPKIIVAVCEDRQTGIQNLKHSAQVILLDDAFQHRKVSASFNILLTSFNKLYSDDYMLPTGNLREPTWGAQRANVIVVTKCPHNLGQEQMALVRQKLGPKPYQELYFSKIGYGSEIRNELESRPISYLKNRKFLLVTGIADPKPLVDFLNMEGMDFDQKSYPDHHNFTSSEIDALKKHPLILTTEKDFMRLRQVSIETDLYYLPIETEFLNGEGFDFRHSVNLAVDTFV